MKLKPLSITRLRAFSGDLDAVLRTTGAAIPKLRISWVDIGGLEAIDAAAASDGYRRRMPMMEQHLSDGGRIAAIFERENPIAWQMFRPREQVSFLWLHLVGDEDTVFEFGAYTVSAWRGKRLFTVLSQFGARRYLEEGFRRLHSVAEFRNPAAFKAHINRGEQPVGWIWRARLPGRLSLVVTDTKVDAGFFGKDSSFVYRIETRRKKPDHP